MARQLKNPNNSPHDLEHHGVRLPTRSGALHAGPSRRPAASPQVAVTRHAVRQVVVLEVVRPLGEVTQELDHEIRLALADEPRGVVCDLSAWIGVAAAAVVADDRTTAIEALASAGRHVRDWPGTPVAMACPDPLFPQALHSHPLGGALTTAESELTAVLAVLSTAPPAVRRLRLDPHTSAIRDSGDFLAFVLLDWGLDQLVHSAGQVLSELVTRSTVGSPSKIDISVAWSEGALRLCVRDRGPGLMARRPSTVGYQRQGESAVVGLSRAHGSLPTVEGGKARWAVLNAALPGPQAALVALEGAAAERTRSVGDH